MRFNHASFRERLETLSRGSNWIGSIPQVFHRVFPPSYAVPERLQLSSAERVGESRAVEYPRLKGYRVYIPLSVPERDLIEFLGSKGYVIEINQEIDRLVNDGFPI